MVKKLKEQLLAAATEAGWDNISEDPKTIKLQKRDSVIKYSVEAKPNDLIAKVGETLHEFNRDRIVLDWFDVPRPADEYVTVDAVLRAVDEVHASLHDLAAMLRQVAEDYEMYISGMQLSRLIGTYTNEQTMELWRAIDGSRYIRRKKTGDGHATRHWYHKQDVMDFCEKYVHDGEVSAPAKSKLNGFYLFVGPSGVGKTAVMDALKAQYGYVSVATCTDRAPRYEGEPGHIFVTEDEFKAMKGIIAPTVFSGHHYGITPDALDAADMAALDMLGMGALKWACKKKNRPVHVIGLMANQEELRSRMNNRGDSPEKVYERMKHDREHFKHYEGACDVVVQNNDLATTVNIISALISNWERMDKASAVNSTK